MKHREMEKAFSECAATLSKVVSKMSSDMLEGKEDFEYGQYGIILDCLRDVLRDLRFYRFDKLTSIFLISMGCLLLFVVIFKAAGII